MTFSFLVLLAAIAGSIIWSSIQNGITPTPTAPKVKYRFIQTLPEELNGTILELGAGWGTLAFPLALRYPHCTIVAYESSWIPYLFCRLRQVWNPLPNLLFIRKNFFHESFREASLVVCYLYPDAMKQLREKFVHELPNHTIIASHTFAIPGWTPIFTATVDDLYHTKIYHYSAIH